jgi:hypothetical protein
MTKEEKKIYNKNWRDKNKEKIIEFLYSFVYISDLYISNIIYIIILSLFLAHLKK